MATHRQVFGTILCLLGGVTAMGWAQDEQNKPKSPKKTDLFSEKPLEVDPNSDEITRLRIERRNVAVEGVQAAHALFLGGRGDFVAVAKAAEFALEAQIDVPGSNKLQILEQYVEIFRELDKSVEERFKLGVVDAVTRSWAKYMRLDMELRLAREKLASKNATN